MTLARLLRSRAPRVRESSNVRNVAQRGVQQAAELAGLGDAAQLVLLLRCRGIRAEVARAGNACKSVMERAGIEPATSGLQSCATSSACAVWCR
jgi:hypothetical protein